MYPKSTANRWPLRFAVSSAVMLAIAAALTGYAADAVKQARLQRHRHLGKALYESPTGYARAVDEFRQAVVLAPDSLQDRLNLGLALLRAGRIDEGSAFLLEVQKRDPSLPHPWFALGLSYRKLSRVKDGIRQMEGFVKLVPDDAIGHHNLGLLYDLDDQPDLALRQFEAASRLDPRLVAPYFQIYTRHRLAGRTTEANAALASFRRAKQAQQDLGESEDVEWNPWCEIAENITPPTNTAALARPALRDIRLPGVVDAATAGSMAIDADGDRRPDLLVWSRRGIRVYRNGEQALTASGLEPLEDIVSVAAGDYDDDGLADLCILTNSGASLYRNEKGVFVPVPSRLPSGRFEVPAWLDYDHDGDLDLLLLARRPALLRNEGKSGFANRTADFPFIAGEPLSAAVTRTISETKAFDIAVSFADRPAVLYRDRLRGRYEAETIPAIPPGARSLATFDVNHDGWMDLAFSRTGATSTVLNRRGTLHGWADTMTPGSPPALVDFDNRGYPAVVTQNGMARTAADFNGDGRTDLAVIHPDGSVHLLINHTMPQGRWISVSLEGVKTGKLALGAEIEIRAGALYQKRLYEGVPVVFGLGPNREADTVRITWPKGMIQNELRQIARRSFTYKEAPRLSGSCPMVFTWNGREFQFVTDVLGVAPLGASAGDGAFFPADHDEYVQIPSDAIKPQDDGRLEVRITEELKEVAYIDQVRLFAVDHPSDTRVLTNEKFKSPPFPDFRLFGVRRPSYAARAADGQGVDQSLALRQKDRRYATGFACNSSGVAELHTIDVDFGRGAARDNRALLVLHGWTDWADGSTFVRTSQESGGGLVSPYLQVKDASGAWRTVIQDMGLPAGKPKTIVVDLSGKFLSASREIRIVTNLCIYWDEIFLSEDTASPALRLSALPAASADLRFRGFSRPVIHPQRKQPEVFDYSTVSTTSIWSPTPGRYTRYGGVSELAQSVDDRYIIMGSGDELRLLFDSSGLPAVRPGWTREYLLLVDGWAKDADANTAFGGSVEPLPFHAMSAYPYPRSEEYPPSRNSYQAKFNTRRPFRLLPPLR